MPCFFYLLNGLFYLNNSILTNFADGITTLNIGKVPFGGAEYRELEIKV